MVLEWSKIVLEAIFNEKPGLKLVPGIGNWLARRFPVLSTNFETRVYPPKIPVPALGDWFFDRLNALRTGLLGAITSWAWACEGLGGSKNSVRKR